LSREGLEQAELKAWGEEILAGRKYRQLGIPTETIQDLIQQEFPRHRTRKAVIRSVREKLHNIIAPYLGDPDYIQAALEMETVSTSVGWGEYSRRMLDAHASTRERSPCLEEFYPRLFSVTGMPGRLLDLACGLHPFGLPWMGLPTDTRYYAFDIHSPRVALINRYLVLNGYEPLAEVRDVILHPPQVYADVAFFFKEAHRFEQRQRGCNRDFWRALRVKWLIVSLPAASLNGRHDLAEGHRRLVHTTLEGLDWPVTEWQVGNELVFCLRCWE
jgi:16S rRNA (guanine(1405)-N(7))-methyltransferase